ncbi:MAG: hypothetical protein DRP42_00560 [Tenericutes bacterium]|nr:MAG: hypothetical protein DRP42_00560 [Mycoplasmatota bacterium]
MGDLKTVNSKQDLDLSKFYALHVSDDTTVKELARFVGMCESGAAFKVMDTPFRQDHALDQVVIRTEKIGELVFELKENHE